MKSMSITLLNQLKVLSGLIIVSLLYLPFVYYVSIKYGQDKAIFVLLPYLVIFCIPVFYLHFTYYHISKGSSYKVGNGKIIQIDGQREIGYEINDIKKIDLYMNGNRLRNESFRRFPFQDYFYSVIELKKGKEIIITCLHSYSLDNILTQNLPEIEINKHNIFYPMLKLKQKNV